MMSAQRMKMTAWEVVPKKKKMMILLHVSSIFDRVLPSCSPRNRKVVVLLGRESMNFFLLLLM